MFSELVCWPRSPGVSGQHTGTIYRTADPQIDFQPVIVHHDSVGELTEYTASIVSIFSSLRTCSLKVSIQYFTSANRPAAALSSR